MKVKIFGKSIPVLAIVAIAMSAGMASAALLSYYGTITGTVGVEQSVLVDEGNYLETNVYSEDIVAGSSVMSAHTLRNRAEVPATVMLVTDITAVDNEGEPMRPTGVTTTYFKPIGYYMEKTFEVEGLGGSLEITVENDDGWVTWTFDFPVEEWTGNGAISAFVAISLDGDTPAFIIHNNDGKDSTYEWGAWLYSEYDSECDIDFPIMTSNIPASNTPVSNIDWVEASGERDAQGTGGILQVRIKKCELGEAFRYMASSHACSGWDGTNPNTKMAIGPADWADAPSYIKAELATEISTFALQPGETLDFYIVSEFNVALIPGTYTITTTVEPVLQT